MNRVSHVRRVPSLIFSDGFKQHFEAFDGICYVLSISVRIIGSNLNYTTLGIFLQKYIDWL
jgi:hypothetical protein